MSKLWYATMPASGYRPAGHRRWDRPANALKPEWRSDWQHSALAPPGSGVSRPDSPTWGTVSPPSMSVKTGYGNINLNVSHLSARLIELPFTPEVATLGAS